MNELTIFNFEENEIRTGVKDGEICFCHLDCCKAINLQNASQALQRLNNDNIYYIYIVSII